MFCSPRDEYFDVINKYTHYKLSCFIKKPEIVVILKHFKHHFDSDKLPESIKRRIKGAKHRTAITRGLVRMIS